MRQCAAGIAEGLKKKRREEEIRGDTLTKDFPKMPITAPGSSETHRQKKHQMKQLKKDSMSKASTFKLLNIKTKTLLRELEQVDTLHT